MATCPAAARSTSSAPGDSPPAWLTAQPCASLLRDALHRHLGHVMRAPQTGPAPPRQRRYTTPAKPLPACDELPGDRFAGGALPPLPCLGIMRLPVGVQEQVRAERAASVLHLEQAQGAAVGRGLVPAAPLVPADGQGRVVG